MDFPLYTHTYELKGRIYRRNPHKGFRSDEEVAQRGGDTADLYGDEDNNDDGPSCAPVKPKHSSKKKEKKKLEVRKEARKEVIHEEVILSTAESDDTAQSVVTITESVDYESLPDTVDTTSDSTQQGETKTKKWTAEIEVPRELIRFVVGVKGKTKRQIEQETECRIKFPKKGEKTELPVEIVSAKSQECVERCLDRINLLMMNAREKAPFTHFVSFSMSVPEIQTSFAQFAEAVQNDEELAESCRDAALFQEEHKLHITVVMLSLLDSNDRSVAAKSLDFIVEDRVKKSLEGKPLEVEVRGLQYMNDDPAKVHVLFANVISDKLNEVANAIADGMGDAGLAPRKTDVVKIHLTLMNTRYAWEKRKKRGHMDVTKLMEKYGTFYFGHTVITEAHISSLNDPKDEHGYYTSVATVKF